MSAPSRSRLQTWLQLLRAPNLFTVPGDPLAGFLLVSRGQLDHRAGLAVLASLCFYAFGLLLNDLADLAEDRRERPSRPLPSGAASIGAVWTVTGLLALSAMGFCFAIGSLAIWVGAALLVAVLLYNTWSKRIAALGPLNMGLCRGLSLLLGAAAAVAADPASNLASIRPLASVAAGGITVFILFVTHLARIETHAHPPLLPRVLPFAGLIAAIVPVFVLGLNRSHPLASFNAGLYAISAWTIYAGYRVQQELCREPAPPIPPMIGRLIRLLLPLQAVYCLCSHSLTGAAAAAALLVLWPVSRAVSRRFYAS